MSAAWLRVLVAVTSAWALLAMVTVSSSALAQSPLQVRWLSVGDSYSSGEGIARTEERCQRSNLAWAPAARSVGALAQAGGSEFWFVACTGAKTADLDAQVAEARSSGAGDERFDLITFTFGGNDIGFAEVMSDCIGLDDGIKDWGWFKAFDPRGCDVTEAELADRLDQLGGDLRRFYQRIHDDLLAPGGHIVVLTYPQVFEPSSQWGLWRGFRCDGVTRHDVAMLRRIGERLAETIAAAGSAVEGVQVVDVRPTFAGHGLCSRDEWLNGPTIGFTGGQIRTEKSFHPHTKGHAAQAGLVRPVLDSLAWSPSPLMGCPAKVVCVGEFDIDVDGDGAEDKVAAWLPWAEPGPGVHGVLQVTWADGTTADAQVTPEYDFLWVRLVLIGAADLDGTPGAEIVFSDSAGAHSRSVRLFTADGRRLVDTGAYLFIDGAVASLGGFECVDRTGDGKAEIVSSGAIWDWDAGWWEIYETVYSWQGKRLIAGETRHRIQAPRQPSGESISVPEVDRLAGIHCSGLPEWPEDPRT